MHVDTEEKLKIATLSCIGTVLLCSGSMFLGTACFSILLPWSRLARVTAWLVTPIVNFRIKKPMTHSIVVQAEARPL